MKVIRVGRICLLAMLALGVVATSSASAAVYEVKGLPEVGRCIKVGRGKGVYRAGLCIARDPSGAGSYEWTPVSATEKQTFSGSGTETTLATSGHWKIHCIDANFSGEWRGPKTATVTVEMQGCQNQLGVQCTSLENPNNKSEIKTPPLEAELGFIKNLVKEGKLTINVGLDLKPQPPLTEIAAYECGSLTETAKVEGSVIGEIKPINKMTLESNLVYKLNSHGEQLVQHFQEGPQDTLSTTFTTGLESTTAPSTLKVLGYVGHNANALEIKAKES